MPPRCECRTLSVIAGNRALSYCSHFLAELSRGEDALLMRCRVCGAFWEMREDDLTEDGARRVHLRRVRTPAVVEDWRSHEGEDGD